MRTRLPVVLAACAALAACGGDKSTDSAAAPRATTTPTDSRPDATARMLAGGVTTLTLDPAARTILSYVGVQLTGVDGAAGRDGTLRFPVSGGRLSLAPLRGDVEHAGALRISLKGRHVDATNLRLDPAKDVVTGVIEGRRVPLLRVDVGEPTTLAKPERPFALQGDAAVIGDRVLSALGSESGMDVLRGGLPLGTLRTSLY